MNEDIIFRVKEQLSKDYNCTIEDFNNQNTLITDKKIIEGSRKYTDEDEILKILIFNGKAIISADKCIKEWCIKNLSRFPGAWMFFILKLKKNR